MKEAPQPAQKKRNAPPARAPAQAAPKVAPELARERPQAALAPARNPRGPSMLDHLRRARLGEGWKAAAAEPSQPLPGRADLERRLGASLAGVRVHSGPAARSLLDHLGARGAASGRVILLRDARDAETAAHEAAHVVQSEGEAGAAGPSAPIAADHPAEREAAAVMRGRGRARVRVRLRAGALALRRANDAATMGTDSSAARGVENDRAAERGAAGASKTLQRARAPPAAKEEAGEAQALVPEEGPDEPTPSGAGEEPAEAREEMEAETAAGPEPGPDRQAQARQSVDDSQAVWDEGATTADEHVVETCRGQKNQPGTKAFKRGPPLQVPEKKAAKADTEDPKLEEVEDGELTRAESKLDQQVAKAPARGPPVDSSGLSEDQRKERDKTRAEIRGRIEKKIGPKAKHSSKLKKLERLGSADPKRAETSKASAEKRAQAAEEKATEGAKEDFGEDRLAPVKDPTEGHDRELKALKVPKVDVASLVDQGAMARIGTYANAGSIPIDDVVLVQDHEMRAQEEAVRAQQELEQKIDASIADSERELEAGCKTSTQRRGTLKAAAESGVATRRGKWSTAIGGHVAKKRGEADALTKQKLKHADELETEANKKAEKVLTAADRKADAKLEETEERSEEKAKEAENKSWWERGIDAISSLIKGIVDWIDAFIEDCHKAIDALLDAASAVAHGIVSAGHKAVSLTLDALGAGLDLIADNLPGELGDLAREHRDDIHDFLDSTQKEVDGWAEDLHAAIDTEIEDLRQDLHEGLDDLQQDVHDAADALDDLLKNGLMAFLRANYPELAALVDAGLNGPIKEAADQLGEWARAALEGAGFSALKGKIEELHDETFCEAKTEEEQAEECDAFKKKLDGASREISAFLDSPFVQSVRSLFEDAKEDQESQQVDAVTGFFEFIRWVAKPVYDWWKSVEPIVTAALDALGEIASDIWRHVAIALGIDPSLSPLEALAQGLEKLWEAVSEAVAPLVQGIKDAWQWLRNDSPLAPVFDFFAKIPEAWESLKGFASDAAGDVKDWLVKKAQELSQTVLPAVNSALSAASSAAHSAVSAIESFVGGVIGVLDAILGWEPGIELVEIILTVISALLTPLRVALQLFHDCVIKGLRLLADGLRDLVTLLGKLLDIAAGIALALATFPVGVVMFFAGNIWLYVIPDCYKAPILNFLLDVAIKFLKVLPEPADLGLAIVYTALLNFLIGLRNAPDEQKVGAMNLFASIYAGNAEVAAGFLVGVAEGVWEATGGTIIFLLQAVAWLVALPFKLGQWAFDRIRGKGAEEGEEGEEASEEPEVDEPEAPAAEEEPGVVTLRRRERVLPSRAAAEAQDAEQELEEEPEEATEEEPAEAESELEEEVANEEELAELQPALARAGGRPSGGGEITRVLRRAPSGPAEVSGEVAEEVLEGPQAEAAAMESEGELEAEQEELAPEEEAATETESGAASEAEALDVEDPPAAPGALSDLQGTLSRFLDEGFTREDVRKALDAAKAGLREAIGKVAQEAAASLLASLNAQGAGFALGRTIGAIVGQIVVEVLIAIFTAGAGAAVSVAKGALAGARVTAKLGSVLKKVKAAIEPALKIVSKLKGALGDVLGAIQKWFDDVLRWMKGIVKRTKGRLPKGRPRAPRPRARPRGRPRGRPKRGRGGPRRPARKGPKRPSRGKRPSGPKHKQRPKKGRPTRGKPKRKPKKRKGGQKKKPKKKKKKKKKDKDSDDKRRRLRRAVAAMEPKLNRMLDDGVSRIRLIAQLGWWRVSYRLTTLSIRPMGRRFKIRARLNPTIDFGDGFHPDRDEVYRMVRQIAQARFERAQARAKALGTTESLETTRSADLPKGEDPSALGAAIGGRTKGVPKPKRGRAKSTGGRGKKRGTQRKKADTPDTTLTFKSADGVKTFGVQKAGVSNVVISGLGKYPEIAQKLARHGLSPKDVAKAVFELIATGKGHPDPAINRDIMRLATLMFGTEVARSSTTAATAALTMGGMASGKLSTEEAFDVRETSTGGRRRRRQGKGGLFPPSQEGFVGATKRAEQRVDVDPTKDKQFNKRTKAHRKSEETINRTVALVQKLVAGMDFDDMQSLRREIERQLELADAAFRAGAYGG